MIKPVGHYRAAEPELESAFSVAWRAWNPRPLPRATVVRKGTERDERGAFDVMRRSTGFETEWLEHQPIRAHLRESQGASFWVAEDQRRTPGTISGYARSIIRDRICMLTEFFVQPNAQRQGVGQALVHHCFGDAVSRGARDSFVLASMNGSAQSLYFRCGGCVPRDPMLLLSGSLKALSSTNTVNRHPPGNETWSEPVILTPRRAHEVNALDRAILGFTRPSEHQFWERTLGGPSGPSRLYFERKSPGSDAQLVGYAYIGAACNGPALAARPEALPGYVAAVSSNLATRELSGNGLRPAEHCMAVSGRNEVMLKWLLQNRWHIIFNYTLMSSAPMAGLDRYVCHNPLYVL